VLVIVASQWDHSAKALAKRWADCGAGILTPRDLSVEGWRLRPGDWDDGAIVVDGKRVAQREITGVLTRLPCATAQELIHIAPEDRRYVASEMTAFLLFWLSQLRCPVLNRPTAACLAGPFWRQEQWVHVAATAGVPVQPVRRIVGVAASCAENTLELPPAVVTVVGKHTMGDGHRVLHRAALRIAKLARAELLSVSFSGPCPDAKFIGAGIFPDLGNEVVADAVLDHLESAQAAHS